MLGNQQMGKLREAREGTGLWVLSRGRRVTFHPRKGRPGMPAKGWEG